MSAKPIPEGYHTVTPYLVVKNAGGVLDFLSKAFGATEPHVRMTREDGTIRHCEVRVGDSMMMISDATEDYPARPGMFYIYVEDVDTVFERAKSAGGTVVAELTDHEYGDRSGGVSDAAGNQWWIATHIKDVSNEELEAQYSAKN